MSFTLSPLQGGRRRGRRARWALVGFLLIGVAVTAAALLGLTAGEANGPTQMALRAPRKVAPSTPVRSDYGTVLAPAAERVTASFKHNLRSGMLFDVTTGRVLWQLDSGQELPIASLTKMMTALVVVARSRPSDRVLVTPQAIHFSGSGIGMLPLHKLVPELALLYGLLLPSGNDAAIALAQHVAGTEPAFIAIMNQRARQLGLSCTHFTTDSGIVDRGNHSCAADLALMAHEVLEQPLLGRIVASRGAIVPFPIKGGKLYLYNNNPLLIVGYPGADGVKTGFTTASGPCLVAAGTPRWHLARGGAAALGGPADPGRAVAERGLCEAPLRGLEPSSAKRHGRR